MGCGHLVFFLEKYNNLSRFQQQGWEALNALLQHHFHNNTNKGGSEGRQKEKVRDEGKHAKALARLCMRRNMWHFGIGQEFFNGSYMDGTNVDPADYDNPTNGTASAAASAANGDGEMDEDIAGVPGAVDGLEDPGL